MGKHKKTARLAVAVAGVGALVIGSALPGTIAIAEDTGDVQSQVTRAVAISGNADAELSRAILVTQINVDGNGTSEFTVPVVEGGAPKNMDSFGGPEVVDGQAQYNLTVDGPQTFRTQQNFPIEDIPVTVAVEAELDGQPMKPSELAGKTGLVKLKYTFTNNTGEPTQITYKDALGKTTTEEQEIPVPMAAATTILFPDSWQEVSAPKASVVTGNGQNQTQVQATQPMFPSSLPGQSPTQTLEIEARVTNAVVPPADIKVAILNPQEVPDVSSKIKEAKDGSKTAASITDAGVQLNDGGNQLQEGLAEAADGAQQIADGVAQQLGPGVTQLTDGLGQLSDGLNQFNDVAISTLREEAAGLPASVTADPSFAQLTDGFESLRTATSGIQEALGQWTPAVKTSSSQKPGQWIKNNGKIDKGRTNVARTLWALVYGARQQDVPTDSRNRRTDAVESNGGLTNPDCKIEKPKDPNNPCGAYQIIDAVVDGFNSTLVPALEQLLSSGPKEIAGKLSNPEFGGGAWVIKTMADALGCQTTGPANAPIVPPVSGTSIAELLAPGTQPCSKPITVGGNEQCPNPAADLLPVPTLSCNLVVNALLGGVDVNIADLNVKAQFGGLSQSLFNPLKLDGQSPDPSSGLANVLGTFYPIAYSTAVKPGIEGALDGLVELNGVITTNKDGWPDRDTEKKNTATGIIMQTRASLAEGGIGSDGYPAQRCAAYNSPGNPGSGVNENANADRVKETCAAGDVLNVMLFGLDKIEDGVSTTLLEGISEKLLEGVGTFFSGCEPTSTLACAAGSLAEGGNLLFEGGTKLNEGVNGPGGLAFGTNALAEGLPAAVDGAGKIADGGKQLRDSGNEGSKTAGNAIAVFEAMQSRVDAGGAVPGGMPEGVDKVNGVYAFALDGAGGSATENAARAGLGFLGLIAAGGIGAILSSRGAG